MTMLNVQKPPVESDQHVWTDSFNKSGNYIKEQDNAREKKKKGLHHKDDECLLKDSSADLSEPRQILTNIKIGP